MDFSNTITMDDVVSALEDVDAARKALDDAVSHSPTTGEFYIDKSIHLPLSENSHTGATKFDLDYGSSFVYDHAIRDRDSTVNNMRIPLPVKQINAISESLNNSQVEEGTTSDAWFNNLGSPDSTNVLRDHISSLEKELKQARSNVAHVNSFFEGLSNQNQELQNSVDALFTSKTDFENGVEVLKSKIAALKCPETLPLSESQKGTNNIYTPYPSHYMEGKQTDFIRKSAYGKNSTELFIRKVKSDLAARNTRLMYSALKRDAKESARVEAKTRKRQESVEQKSKHGNDDDEDTPLVARKLNFLKDTLLRRDDPEQKNMYSDKQKGEKYSDIATATTSFKERADSIIRRDQLHINKLGTGSTIIPTPHIARKLNFESP